MPPKKRQPAGKAKPAPKKVTKGTGPRAADLRMAARQLEETGEGMVRRKIKGNGSK